MPVKRHFCKPMSLAGCRSTCLLFRESWSGSPVLTSGVVFGSEMELADNKLQRSSIERPVQHKLFPNTLTARPCDGIYDGRWLYDDLSISLEGWASSDRLLLRPKS